MYTTESIFPAMVTDTSAQTIQLELTAQEAQNYMYQVSIREGGLQGPHKVLVGPGVYTDQGPWVGGGGHINPAS